MKYIFFFVTLTNYLRCIAWDPKLYPYNPQIHNLGNNGLSGAAHSLIAPFFTKYLDYTVYGRNIREEVIESQDKNKSILDIGCGTGFSTSYNKNSLGLDASEEMINTAKLIFPDKNFKQHHIEYWKPDKNYDITTIMFMFHEVPNFARKNIVKKIKEFTKEKIIVVDISPYYKPNPMMLSGEPYIDDYLKNIQTELHNFDEEIIVKNHVHKWTFHKT